MIYTIHGAIEPSGIGSVLMHEHIAILANDMLKAFGKGWVDREKLIEYTSDIFHSVKQRYGIGLFVDGTPIDLGRDAGIIKEVSERCGMETVLSTGFYWYPLFYTGEYDEDQIADFMVREWEDGIGDTGIKPGILKAATDHDGLTDQNIKILKAVGIAQRRTGLAVYIHSSHEGDQAVRQIEYMMGQGAAPEKLVIGHSARRLDADYLEGILKTGCNIAIDQCHCVEHGVERAAMMLVELCRRGYTGQIVLSNDQYAYSDFENKNIKGFHIDKKERVRAFGCLFDELYPAFIREGGNQTDWERMLYRNPVQILNVSI